MSPNPNPSGLYPVQIPDFINLARVKRKRPYAYKFKPRLSYGDFIMDIYWFEKLYSVKSIKITFNGGEITGEMPSYAELPRLRPRDYDQLLQLLGFRKSRVIVWQGIEIVQLDSLDTDYIAEDGRPIELKGKWSRVGRMTLAELAQLSKAGVIYVIANYAELRDYGISTGKISIEGKVYKALIEVVESTPIVEIEELIRIFPRTFWEKARYKM